MWNIKRCYGLIQNWINQNKPQQLFWAGQHPLYGWLIGVQKKSTPDQLKTLLKPHHIQIICYWQSSMSWRFPLFRFKKLLRLLHEHRSHQESWYMVLEKLLKLQRVPIELRWPMLEILNNLKKGLKPHYRTNTQGFQGTHFIILQKLYESMWSSTHATYLSHYVHHCAILNRLQQQLLNTLSYPIYLLIILIIFNHLLGIHQTFLWMKLSFLATIILIIIFKITPKSYLIRLPIMTFLWIYELNMHLQINLCLIQSLKSSSQFKWLNQDILRDLSTGISCENHLKKIGIPTDYIQLFKQSTPKQFDLFVQPKVKLMQLRIQFFLKALSPCILIVVGLHYFKTATILSQLAYGLK